MKCPACADATLVMSDRQGVEIDYCPACRGVWLDRGELDKLIERSGQPAVSQQAATPGQPRSRPDFADSDHGHDHGRGPGGARKKNWLSNIFD